MSIYYGEILRGYPPSSTKNKYKDRYEYDVIIWFSHGSQLVTNVRVSGDFDGPDDFSETILRGSQDDGGKGGYVTPNSEEASTQAGTRVLVAFTGDAGSINYYSGFIISTIAHPKNTTLLNGGKTTLLPSVTTESAKPQKRVKFNGVFTSIDALGQYRIQYNGLPTIKPNTNPLSKLPTIAENGQMTLDLLQKSVFRLVDNNKQGLVIDSFGKYISLSNQITPPTTIYGADDTVSIGEVTGTGTPKGQEVRLDTAASTLWLRSSGSLNLISSKQLNKNDEFSIDSKNITMTDNSGGTFTMAGGKVAIGTGAAEIVSLAIGTIDALLTSVPIGLSATGPVNISPVLVVALTKVKILLSSIKK